MNTKISDSAPALWGVRIGDSDTWGYVEAESDADFIGRKSGLSYEKRPFYLHPHLATVAVPVARLPDYVRSAISGLAHIAMKDAPQVAMLHVGVIDNWLNSTHPQPAALNEVSGNSGELGGDAPGITDKWVLEYLDTDAPESSREAIRNAFAEWNSLADNGALRGGRITGWAMVDGIRVFSASSHSGILDDQQFVRYDDHLAALAATGKQQVAKSKGSEQ